MISPTEEEKTFDKLLEKRFTPEQRRRIKQAAEQKIREIEQAERNEEDDGILGLDT